MRLSRLFCIAMIACCGLPGPAETAPARCYYFSGTADALVKSNAVEGALNSLNGAIDKWKSDNGITGPVVQTAEPPKPHPYWRSEVAPELFLPPDIVTDTTYTICWKGVVSPVVCTAGAKLCW